jgi:hypothetical protein
MKKRGVILVIIVLVLAFIVMGVEDGTSERTAETPPSPSPLIKYEAIQMQVNCDSEITCSIKSVNIDEYALSIRDIKEGACDEPDKGEIPGSFPSSDYGCYFAVKEDDSAVVAAHDDCFYTTVPPGFNVDEEYMTLGQRLTTWDSHLSTIQFATTASFIVGGGAIGAQIGFVLGGGPVGAVIGLVVGGLVGGALDLATTIFGDEDPDAKIAAAKVQFRFHDKKGVICGGDQYWHQCDAATVGALYWVNIPFEFDGKELVAPAMLYKCTNIGENRYVWRNTTQDMDIDGYQTNQADCNDYGYYDAYLGCPILEEEEYQGRTQEEIRETMKSKCVYPQHANCANCINPGAVEVCGDGINNDCRLEGNSFSAGSLSEPGGSTPDSCNSFKFGCEATPEEIEKNDGNIEVLQHTNVYGYPLSYVEGAEGGSCCGFKGLEDLGKTVEGNADAGFAGSYVCLNSDERIVGAETVEGEILPGWDSERCEGEWCWVSGINVGSRFNVLTLKRPGEDPYDITSNGLTWQECKLGTQSTLNPPPAGLIGETSYDELTRRANRYTCYQEGNHWSWAECTGNLYPRQNIGVKGRYPGEGLFSLPLSFAETNEPQPVRFGKAIDINANFLRDYYGPDFTFDFTGYTYLNFMAKFCEETAEGCADLEQDDVKLPAGINVKMLGPVKNGLSTTYLDRPVLGDVINNVFEKESWMHIKMPIPNNIKDVRSLIITSSPPTNSIKITDVYASADTKPQLCSGQDATASSSWLTTIDQGDAAKEIDGEDLCTTLYGPNAWLGTNEEINSESAGKANCCGNDANEYYAGSSKSTGEDQQTYGCWNSQPLAESSSTMNVEFSVTYKDKIVQMDYPPDNYQYKYSIGKGNFIPVEDVLAEGEEKKSWVELLETYSNHEKIFDPADMQKEEGKVYLIQATNDFVQWKEELQQEGPTSGSISYVGFPQKIHEFIINKAEHFVLYQGEHFGKVTLENINSEIELSFVDAFTGEDFGLDFQVSNLNNPFANKIYIMAEYKKVDVSESLTPQSKTSIFSCDKEECLFPLPGLAPYTITNPHPELYQLYFVKGEAPEDEILITNNPTQSFDVPGNIKAKKVSQQVIYVQEENEGSFTQKFYGCQAADFVGSQAGDNYENLNYCSAKSQSYCAFQDNFKKDHTLINSWSSEPITTLGYNPLSEDDLFGLGIGEVFSLLTLKESGEDSSFFPAVNRSHATSVLPGRNFLPNSEFILFDRGNLIGWEIITGGNLLHSDGERRFLESMLVDDTLSLNGNTLRSERIAVPQNVVLHFSQQGDCEAVITLVDSDGNSLDADPRSIDTGLYSSLTIEFSGTCQVQRPSLQLIDNRLGPIYDAVLPPSDDGSNRAGIACCPNNYCWNGYSCVEPMGTMTYTSEHIRDNVDFRCVGGKWTNLPAKLDWNGDKWGFCGEKTQCFVVSSNEDRTGNYSAATFTQRQYPSCINDGEYIFDNYCKEGFWTSRTKFLAEQMLEVVESNDYALYCSDFQDSLLDLSGKEAYLSGTEPVEVPGELETQVINVCFKEIFDDLGQRLIPARKNTCVNNVCVLKHNGDSVVIGTTLNKPINDQLSLLGALNLPPGSCSGEPQDGLVICDAGSNTVWYNPELNSLIFSKDEIVRGRFLQKLTDFFRAFFGKPSKFDERREFIKEAKNFRDLYLLKVGDREIKAMREILSHNQTLVAEYVNFETPVCDYVNHLEVSDKGPVLPGGNVACSEEDGTQRVEALFGLDFLWPQLTGKMRVGE